MQPVRTLSRVLRFVGAAALLSVAVSAQAIQLGVPSYWYPGNSGFTTLSNIGGKCGILILNPGNGEIDPNDAHYDSENLAPWVTQSQQSHTSATKVFCYVHSSYGTRSISLVEGDIDTYFSAGFTVDGIFVDEVSTSWSSYGSSYYQPLYNYIKTKHPGTLVAINPGAVPDGPNWMNYACDICMDFESSYSQYKGVFVPSWVWNYPASRFWNVAYNLPSSTSAVDSCFTTAGNNNAGYLYVTDLSARPNPYASLPGTTVWNEEVADATTSSGGSTVPPVPSGLTATAGSGQVSLTWNGSSGATSYNIYRSTTSGGEGTTPYRNVGGTAYIDTNVTGGTTYYYTVAAVNSVGTSSQSGEVSATPTSATIFNETESVNGSNVTFSFNYTGSWTYYHVFLDTDLNASTGYTIGGIGADYLIENGGLYKSTANGSSWSWASAGSVTYTNSGGVATFTLPLSAIGSPAHFNVVYQVASSSSSYNTGEFSY